MSIARRVTLAIAENNWTHFGVTDFQKFRMGLAIGTGVVSTGAASYFLHQDKRVAENNPWAVRWLLTSSVGAAIGLSAFAMAGFPALIIGIPLSASATCLGINLSSNESYSKK